MRRIPAAALALVLAAGTLPVACSGDGEVVPAARTAPAAEVGASGGIDSLSGPPARAADAEAQPERVYHVLTDFEWYARGEPIALEGTAYTVTGEPVRIDARTLERVAEYGGVDLYRRAGDTSLYVPVFDGYWLGFAPDPNAAPPAPTPPDTTATGN